MEYIYKTKGTCSSQIKLNIEGDIITDVSFTGGCNGNLKAIPALVNGMTVAEIENKLSGIKGLPAEHSLLKHAGKRLSIKTADKCCFF